MSTFILLTPDQLAERERIAHHPLTPAIEYLASSITARVLAGRDGPSLSNSRRVLIGLIGERAGDIGINERRKVLA